MGPDRPQRLTAETLARRAENGGPGAVIAARRAALLAERHDPELAVRALRLAARLEPLDHTPRLALARLNAEKGDLDAARAEANAVVAEAIDEAVRARASFILGEIARVKGETAQARSSYQLTLRIEDALLSTDRPNPTAARWYARARGRVAELDAAEGELVRARSGAEGALAMLRAVAAQTGETPVLAADIADAEMRLAALELDAGEANSARRRLKEAVGRYEALAITETEEPHWRAVLADAWALAAEADYARGAPDSARASMDKALQARLRLAARHPDEEAWALAGTWRLRAALRTAVGDDDVAAESLAQARALAEHLASHSGDAQTRFLVHTLIDQADHALRTGALDQAREAADMARMHAEAQAAAPEAAAHWFAEAAACWDRLGELARVAKAHGKAHEAFSRAVEFRRLGSERDESAPFARGLAAALVKLGEAALVIDAPQSARTAFEESVRLRLALAHAAPNDTRTAHSLAAALERLGLAAQACGDRSAARHAWEDELALADRMFGEDDLEGGRFRAIVQSHLVGLGGPGAEAMREEALRHFDALAQAGTLTDREAALRRKLWSA
jgi:tetratricopeptide (TPR) repeat protein